MNDAQRSEPRGNGAAGRQEEPGGEASQGPNLILLYSLIALALAVAIALAALIVHPFYLRR
jgi:hypothetical protein